MSWRWVDKHALHLLHGESLSVHGGGAGLRDEGRLEAALARPPNLAAYGTPDVAELAASYCIGIAKNHPFIDGNKRAAFLSVGLFLFLNGWRLQASQAEATLAMLAAANSELDEPELATWLREHMARR